VLRPGRMIIALRYDPHTIWLWLTVCHGKIDPFFSSVNHLWKIHPFLRTVNHLFRLGPSKNHGELLVITRLGKCPRCPCPKVSLSSSIVQIDSSLVFDTYCQVLIWDTLDGPLMDLMSCWKSLEQLGILLKNKGRTNKNCLSNWEFSTQLCSFL
jgi:hypothetical protein